MVNKIESAGSMVAGAVSKAAPAKTYNPPASVNEKSVKPVTVDVAEPVVSSADNSSSKAQKSGSVDFAASFSAIQSRKEESSNAAQTVRQLESLKSNVDSMRANLSQIVKMYPPYPKDSSQRAQLLNEVAGLRKLTDQLTIPPAYEAMVSRVNDATAVVSPNSSDVEVGSALATLDKSSASIAAEVKRLYGNADLSQGSGVGEALASEQQSRSIGKSLIATNASIGSDVGKSVAFTLTQ